MAARRQASSRASSLGRRYATRSPSSTRASSCKNPVMFVVEVGSLITTGIFFSDLARGHTGQLWFVGVISVWLWLTVLFANFAEAIAEGRGKAQANALRATRTTTTAHRRLRGRQRSRRCRRRELAARRRRRRRRAR